jgi:hypothetical protein
MRKILIHITVASLILLSFSSPLIPVTGSQELSQQQPVRPSELASWGYPLHSLPNEADRISQVEVPGHLSYKVVEQPQGNDAFISHKPVTLTHFRLAAHYGTIGLIAHNSLAGAAFFDLKLGELINVIYQSQNKVSFQIRSIRSFQALSPSRTDSVFIDLENGSRYTASDLFLEIYGADASLVFQTCLERNGLRTWGRFFVLADQIPHKYHFETLPSEFAQTQTFRTLTMK